MGDCACLYDSADGDQPSFYTTGWRTARKLHRCCECRRVITPGERYEHWSGKWSEGMHTYKTCAECQEIRAALYCDSGWTFEQLWEDVQEQLFAEFGLSVDCVDKLTTAAAKTKLQQAWIQWLEDRQ